MVKQKSALEFMQDPDSWPRWPHLPLKRSLTNGQLETAWFYAGWLDEPDKVITLGNLFSGERHGLMTYASCEAILADGWGID